MTLSKVAKGPRGQLKCNLCQSTVHVKNGDWFVASATTDNQIFLCRTCEMGAKGKYKRASPIHGGGR